MGTWARNVRYHPCSQRMTKGVTWLGFPALAVEEALGPLHRPSEVCYHSGGVRDEMPQGWHGFGKSAKIARGQKGKKVGPQNPALWGIS